MATCARCNSTVYVGEKRCYKCNYPVDKPFWMRAKNRPETFVAGRTYEVADACNVDLASNRPRNFFRAWDYVWAVVTGLATLYLVIKGYDFAFHPRMTIPDPSHDIGFGHYLLAFASIFFLTTLANLRIIPFPGLTVFLSCAAILLLGFTVHKAFWGSGFVMFFSWINIVVWSGAMLIHLLYLRQGIQAVRNNRDPEEAIDDTAAFLFSRSVWQHLMYKNTRRRR